MSTGSSQSVKAPQVSENDSGTFWLNAGLFAQVVIASVLGFVPLAIFLDAPYIPITHAIGVGIITMLIIFYASEMPTDKPSFGEWILSGMSTLYLAAIAGVWGFISYGLIFGVTTLTDFVFGWFGVDLDLNARAIAFWPGAIVGIFMGWSMIYPGFIAIRSTLFSPQRGLRSPSYAFITDARWLKKVFVWFSVILFASAVIVFWYGWRPTPISIAGELFLLFVCQVPAYATRSQHSSSEIYAIQAIARMADAIGYTKVVTMPRIGDPEIDQLLATVQLFAGNDTEAFLADIKTSCDTTDVVSGSEAILLSIAARALADRLGNTSDESPQLIPVMVLVGRKPTASLWAITEEQRIEVVEIPDEKTVVEILTMRDPNELQQIAKDLLHFAGNTFVIEAQQQVGTT